MHTGHTPMALRRSSRVPTSVPILVTTLAGSYFSEVCKTLVVNAHGCALVSPVKFDAGVPLRFHHKDGRETTAHVVSCQPIGSDHRSWKLGAKLERPENFWGLTECPKDWLDSTAIPGPPNIPPPETASSEQLPARFVDNREATLDLVARRLEAPLRRMLAESLNPLQTEISAVQEKLARREANPSRFEVSLSSIPPELEQQLETRLRKDLGPKLLEDSRSQYAQLLETANATIDRRMNQGCDEFTRRASEQLKSVEKQAQEISSQISGTVQDQLHHGLEDFQHKLLDGGNALKRLSEELIEYLQQNLNGEYSVRRAELEELHTSIAAESSRLRNDVGALDGRIAKLDESVQSLESGLDKRLGVMASNTMKDVRTQLESVTRSLLEELTAQSLKIVQDRLAEANDNMTAVQKDTVASISQSVDVQKANALRLFEHSLDETAKLSLDRWRLKLASGLNAAAKSVGEQFQLEVDQEKNA